MYNLFFFFYSTIFAIFFISIAIHIVCIELGIMIVYSEYKTFFVVRTLNIAFFPVAVYLFVLFDFDSYWHRKRKWKERTQWMLRMMCIESIVYVAAIFRKSVFLECIQSNYDSIVFKFGLWIRKVNIINNRRREGAKKTEQRFSGKERRRKNKEILYKEIKEQIQLQQSSTK